MLEKDIENLEKRIEYNAGKIEDNEQRIHQNTGALEILKTFKADSNRFFIMWLLTFFALLITLGYTIYILNDVGTTTTQTVEQENDNGSNNFIGGDGDISG